jgi:hypothetical protein
LIFLPKEFESRVVELATLQEIQGKVEKRFFK